MMLWFKKRKQEKDDRCDKEKRINLEVEAHHLSQRKSIEETRKVTEKFVQRVKDNGFTLRIYSAAGGKR
jgi:hypothetical protein